MNDGEREDFVNSHEALYHDWKASRKSIRNYVRESRALIDGTIRAMNTRPPGKSWRDWTAKDAEAFVGDHIQVIHVGGDR